MFFYIKFVGNVISTEYCLGTNMKWVQPKIAPGLNHYLSGYIQINKKTETI